MSETPRHTPGPWSVKWDKGHCNALIDQASSDEHSYVAMVFEPFEGWPTKANARLIAAAPELLVALKALVRPMQAWHKALEQVTGEQPVVQEALQGALAAIAKAEGCDE